MPSLEILVSPSEDRPGWFGAMAISSLPCFKIDVPVMGQGNSDITALRGLLEMLLRRVRSMEDKLDG